MALTEKRRLFALEYLVDLNGTQAALRAGYSPDGARQEACRLLEDPEVRALVEGALAKRTKTLELTADRVLLELMRLAYCDIGQAYGPDGKLLPLDEMPEDVRRCIAGVETEELFAGRGDERVPIGHLVKVKFLEKTRALELLGKHLKLFVDLIEKRTAEMTREQRIERISQILGEARLRREGVTNA